jgi:hypothetical protein
MTEWEEEVIRAAGKLPFYRLTSPTLAKMVGYASGNSVINNGPCFEISYSIDDTNLAIETTFDSTRALIDTDASSGRVQKAGIRHLIFRETLNRLLRDGPVVLPLHLEIAEQSASFAVDGEHQIFAGTRLIGSDSWVGSIFTDQSSYLTIRADGPIPHLALARG